MPSNQTTRQTSQTPPPRARVRGARHLSRGATERSFNQGLFAYHRGDYSVALVEFEKVCEASAESNDHARFVECCTFILRILAEREDFERIERTEQRVLTVIETADLSLRLKSRAMYILGICSIYQETGHDKAMNRFREAIDFAVQCEDKEALASPLYGAANVLYARGRYDEALRELDRLEILLSCLSMPELQSAAQFLRAMIRRNQDRLDDALEAAWSAYEALKHHPHMVIYLHTLTTLGSIYLLKGDHSCARLYLDLANRSLKRNEFPRLARLIDEGLAKLHRPNPNTTDLSFDTRTGVLFEKSKGEIRFEGQFILRDLLRGFLENPGRVFTKEDLARFVWKEDYRPEIHDNKIYVTIKRLRKLLEADEAKADYILRAKTGYFLNPKVKVVIDDQPIPAQSSPGGDKL